MKITISLATQVISNVLDNKFIQNQVGTAYLYVYGVTEGYLVKATFQRDDGKLIGPYQGMYDTDPEDEYCYIISIPSAATEVAKGLGISMAIYEPQGTDPETYKIYTTVRTGAYVYQNDSIVTPETIESQILDAIYLAISNLAAAKIEWSAIVGINGETLNKNTPIYSAAKTGELDAVVASNVNTHKARTDNPHSVSKSQVGLGNVDNTSDANKPVSTQQETALGLKENISNKKTSWNVTPSNTSYPAEKLVKDSLDLKVDKATTLLGLDLANDIGRIEFVAALGNATTLLAGLMSATDKARLDALHDLLEEDTANTVVDSINEILAIFNSYPEGVDLVTALASKVDKITGKGLSTNDYTDAEKIKVGHLPDNFATYMGNYYTKSQVDTLLDQLTTAYGLTETAIDELAHNDTILISLLEEYDYITLVLKNTNSSRYVFDTKLIDPSLFVNANDVIQLNAWYNGIQYSYGQLYKTNVDFNQVFKFISSDTADTLVIKGYKKDAITSDLVEDSHTGTNYLDEKVSVKASLEELDTQIKANK